MANQLAEVRLPEGWAPDSWQARPAKQLATYPDAQALDSVLGQLAGLPPLVTSWEVNQLREEIAEAQAGRRFVLQGGDCAESFSECTSSIITNRLKVLLQMSLILVHGLEMPVVRVGRFAGQYAKPRSSDSETRDGITLPSYRGDIINSPEFTAESRIPDPQRLLRAHARSAMTMNFVRSLVDSGFADLHHPEYWDLSWVEHSPLADEFKRITNDVGSSLRFLETLSGRAVGSLKRVDFYTGHEALHLHYEQAMTRQVPRQWGWYDLSTHFPWIGMRTADLDGAHMEFFRGLRNPLGIKVGPAMTPQHLRDLLQQLNPDNEPGRITLIHRMGADKIADHLPALIETVQASNALVLWVCDPMHGNTESARSGFKTRQFTKIQSELEQAFDIHERMGSRLGGVHLELTGENVTECTGGARDLSDEDLSRAYKSNVDPRLNYEQALEMAMVITRHKRGIK
ncbi:MAG: 3-deoxy-7-phosphoheptulonate synthase class II [Xanthomonadales bacterium]|jgi:3-deoxy-7-phosphoheptulonate synthase|nr:3-deoxy-7-phosphoheptulonate synthase class II [Xanthomonadales bacterium]